MATWNTDISRFRSGLKADECYGDNRESIMDDIALRSVGFQIHARPKSGSPVWSRRGKLFPQPVAVKIARRELAERRERQNEPVH